MEKGGNLKSILKKTSFQSKSGMAPVRMLHSDRPENSPSRIHFANKIESHVYEDGDDKETEAMRIQTAENLHQMKMAAANQKCSNPSPSAVGLDNGNRNQGAKSVGQDLGPPSVENVFATSNPFPFPAVQQHSDTANPNQVPSKMHEAVPGSLEVESGKYSMQQEYEQMQQRKAAETNQGFGFSPMVDGSAMNEHAQPKQPSVWKAAGNGSYASKLVQTGEIRTVNFRLLQSVSNNDDIDVVIPKETVKTVQDRYKNVLYGYFLGNRLAYPVVEYFAKNAWAKYGFKRLMMNSNGFFFFKFESLEGMENVIRDGPWLIRNNPIFLNIWLPSVDLKKEEMRKISVWVKLHDVPLAAYTEDGLSLLASKIGTPKMLDRYTSDMCLDSWGRSSYARAIIEISADQELKDSISVAIPHLDGEGFTRTIVRVEYEWSPPRCSKCCVFGHTLETCPKCVKIPDINIPQVNTEKDGYTEVRGKKTKKHRPQVSKPKIKVEYRPVQKQKVVPPKPYQSHTQKNKSVSSSNPFMNLKGYDSNGVPIDDFEEEGLEEVQMEKNTGLYSSSGASTPVGVTSYG